MFIFHNKKLKKICYHSNHDNMCITFFEHSCYFFYILALKIIIKKNGLDLKKFHFSQTFWKKYVAMATMIICVKHFVNISDIFFFNSYFENN